MKFGFEISAFLMFRCIDVIQNNLELNIITLHNYVIVFLIKQHMSYCHSSFFFPGGTYTSGDLDLFLPLKNSGKALRSMAWTLQQQQKKLYYTIKGIKRTSSSLFVY